MKDVRFILGLILQLGAGMAMLAMMIYWHGPWTFARWLGLAIGVPALVGLFVARFQLGKAFSVTPQAKKLVTHGLYSKIRNPMYLFSSLLVVGFALATRLRTLLVLLFFLVPVQLMRMGQEARVLEEKFGDEYREYRKKTWF